ncbi:hypothetical protein BJV74DRAFT_858027, partial [Russula compacta]
MTRFGIYLALGFPALELNGRKLAIGSIWQLWDLTRHQHTKIVHVFFLLPSLNGLLHCLRSNFMYRETFLLQFAARMALAR